MNNYIQLFFVISVISVMGSMRRDGTDIDTNFSDIQSICAAAHSPSSLSFVLAYARVRRKVCVCRIEVRKYRATKKQGEEENR